MHTAQMIFQTGCLAICLTGLAAAQAPKEVVSPAPTESGISYGEHRKQQLMYWKPTQASDQPTPCVFYIHGGGWRGGSQTDANLMGMLPQLLDSGITVISVQYRYIQDALAENVIPPVKAPMSDCARALQFVRYHSQRFGIDPDRMIAVGGSAGACTSLWLALHDDMQEPDSDDPIARQSTRLMGAAVIRPQTTLDPKQMREWTPNSWYGGHAFGRFAKTGDKKPAQFKRFLEAREEVLPWIKAYSPIEHVSSDDPPIYMFYSDEPKIGQKQGDPTHTSNFGVKLQERLEAVGVECELFHKGADVPHASVESYLLERLTGG
jgi:acetyl esterase/lipase